MTRQEIELKFEKFGKVVNFKDYGYFYLIRIEYDAVVKTFKNNHAVTYLGKEAIPFDIMPTRSDLKAYEPERWSGGYYYKSSGYKVLNKSGAEKRFKLMSELIESGKVSIEPTNLTGIL